MTIEVREEGGDEWFITVFRELDPIFDLGARLIVLAYGDKRYEYRRKP